MWVYLILIMLQGISFLQLFKTHISRHDISTENAVHTSPHYVLDRDLPLQSTILWPSLLLVEDALDEVTPSTKEILIRMPPTMCIPVDNRHRRPPGGAVLAPPRCCGCCGCRGCRRVGRVFSAIGRRKDGRLGCFGSSRSQSLVTKC